MKFSRRQFLKYGVGLGASAGIGIALLRSRTTAAQGSSEEHFTYKGRRVDIIETAQRVDVAINGRHQHHIKKLGPARIASHLFPFKNYQSTVVLVKGLIDAEDAQLFVL